jgi:hypothetical protein
MEDLAELATAAIGFAAGEHLAIVPAVPQHDYGPEVCLSLPVPGYSTRLMRPLSARTDHDEAARAVQPRSRRAHLPGARRYGHGFRDSLLWPAMQEELAVTARWRPGLILLRTVDYARWSPTGAAQGRALPGAAPAPRRSPVRTWPAT